MVDIYRRVDGPLLITSEGKLATTTDCCCAPIGCDICETPTYFKLGIADVDTYDETFGNGVGTITLHVNQCAEGEYEWDGCEYFFSKIACDIECTTIYDECDIKCPQNPADIPICGAQAQHWRLITVQVQVYRDFSGGLWHLIYEVVIGVAAAATIGSPVSQSSDTFRYVEDLTGETDEESPPQVDCSGSHTLTHTGGTGEEYFASATITIGPA